MDNPQIWHGLFNPLRLRIWPRKPFTGFWVTNVTLPVPDDPTHIKLISQYACAAFAVPTDRRVTPGPAMGANNVFSIQFAGNGFRRVSLRKHLKYTDDYMARVKGYPKDNTHTLRYFIATRVRGLKEVRVDREQGSLWLGHGKRDATSWYESHDPEFLLEASQATTIIIEKLDALTIRDLSPPQQVEKKSTVQIGNRSSLTSMSKIAEFAVHF